MWRSLCIGLAAAVTFFLVGYDTFSVPAQTQLERGRAVYNFRCYFCHGYAGDARTLAARFLRPAPRDFTTGGLNAARIEQALREGRAGTAMKSFVGVIDDDDIRAVASFVAHEFVRGKASNTSYHTVANGWPDHGRFAQAFPFATGDIALDAPAGSLTAAQLSGRALFMQTCISCHDQSRVDDAGPAWSARPVSYPRLDFVPGQPNTPPTVDAVSSASVYARHEVVPQVQGLTLPQQRGQRLFQSNCSFCHGGDGTGMNWIGQFMEPKARDLTTYTAVTMPPALLKQRIREGLPGTSMPAWQHVLKPAEIDAVADYVVRVFFQRPAQPDLVAAAPGEPSPAPGFLLPRLDDATRTFSPAQMRGRVWVLNLWASWCQPCREEHPLWVELARRGQVALVGLNHRDDARDAQEWLLRWGDPYALTAHDRSGQVAARLNLQGVPASIVIDAQGLVRHVHRGPVTRRVWVEELQPLIRRLQG
jgi:cytochrome c oxidase cbb3-type subunit III